MRKFLIFLALFCFLLPAGSTTAEGINAAIKEAAKAQGTQLTLGDIAEFTGKDAGRIQELRTLNLGAAPLPGQRLVLNRELLNARLADRS